MKTFCVLFLLAGLCFAQDMSQVEIKTVKLTDNIHMLIGQGGNIGVISGQDDVFIVDDQYAPLTEKIKQAIAAITDKPVRFVLNTHWHFDHTGGNENFGKTGSIIVAHKNVRKRMSAGQFMADFNMQVEPAVKEALPVVTFTKDINFHLNDEEIRVWHPSNAHTDGDAIVEFVKANVVHMGDCYFNGFYPYIDVGSGGSIDGVIATARKVWAQSDDKTQIMPGHGPLSNKAELKAYHDMLVGVRDAVKKLVDAGKTRDEVVAADPLKPWNDTWGKGFMAPDRFAGIVYNSLTQDK